MINCDFCGTDNRTNPVTLGSQTGAHICSNCLLDGVANLVAKGIVSRENMAEALAKRVEAFEKAAKDQAAAAAKAAGAAADQVMRAPRKQASKPRKR